MKKLLKTLLGTSLYLLEQSDGAQNGRDRAARKIDTGIAGQQDISRDLKYPDRVRTARKGDARVIHQDIGAPLIKTGG